MKVSPNGCSDKDYNNRQKQKPYSGIRDLDIILKVVRRLHLFHTLLSE